MQSGSELRRASTQMLACAGVVSAGYLIAEISPGRTQQSLADALGETGGVLLATALQSALRDQIRSEEFLTYYQLRRLATRASGLVVKRAAETSTKSEIQAVAAELQDFGLSLSAYWKACITDSSWKPKISAVQLPPLPGFLYRFETGVTELRTLDRPRWSRALRDVREADSGAAIGDEVLELLVPKLYRQHPQAVAECLRIAPTNFEGLRLRQFECLVARLAEEIESPPPDKSHEILVAARAMVEWCRAAHRAWVDNLSDRSRERRAARLEEVENLLRDCEEHLARIAPPIVPALREAESEPNVNDRPELDESTVELRRGRNNQDSVAPESRAPIQTDNEDTPLAVEVTEGVLPPSELSPVPVAGDPAPVEPVDSVPARSDEAQPDPLVEPAVLDEALVLEASEPATIEQPGFLVATDDPALPQPVPAFAVDSEPSASDAAGAAASMPPTSIDGVTRIEPDEAFPASAMELMNEAASLAAPGTDEPVHEEGVLATDSPPAEPGETVPVGHCGTGAAPDEFVFEDAPLDIPDREIAPVEIVLVTPPPPTPSEGDITSDQEAEGSGHRLIEMSSAGLLESDAPEEVDAQVPVDALDSESHPLVHLAETGADGAEPLENLSRTANEFSDDCSLAVLLEEVTEDPSSVPEPVEELAISGSAPALIDSGPTAAVRIAADDAQESLPPDAGCSVADAVEPSLVQAVDSRTATFSGPLVDDALGLSATGVEHRDSEDVSYDMSQAVLLEDEEEPAGEPPQPAEVSDVTLHWDRLDAAEPPPLDAADPDPPGDVELASIELAEESAGGHPTTVEVPFRVAAAQPELCGNPAPHVDGGRSSDEFSYDGSLAVVLDEAGDAADGLFEAVTSGTASRAPSLPDALEIDVAGESEGYELSAELYPVIIEEEFGHLSTAIATPGFDPKGTQEPSESASAQEDSPEAILTEQSVPAGDPPQTLDQAGLRSMAAAAHQNGDLDLAQRHLRQLLEAVPDDAQGWDSLAQIHVDREEYPQAIECLEKLRSLAPPNGRDRLLTEEWLATVLAMDGRNAEAMAALQASFELAQSRVQAENESQESLSDLGRTLLRLGDAQMSGLDPTSKTRARAVAGALPRYQRNLELREKIVARFGRTADTLREVCTALVRIGDTEFDLGKWQSAFARYSKAIELQREAMTKSETTPDGLRELGRLLEGAASIRRFGGDLLGASATYHSCLEVRLKLVSLCGNRPETLRDLANVLERLGDIARSCGNANDANAFYLRALDHREQVLREFGDSADALHELAELEWRLFQTQPSEASLHLERGRAALQSILDHGWGTAATTAQFSRFDRELTLRRRGSANFRL